MTGTRPLPRHVAATLGPCAVGPPGAVCDDPRHHGDEPPAGAFLSRDTRPTVDGTCLAVADVMAMRGTCSRLAVGCVLATERGHILASGYNGTAAGEPHCSHLDDAACLEAIHAEVNAVAAAAAQGIRTAGLTAYLTNAPCLPCAGVLLAAGIARVVYRRAYRLTAGLERLEAARIPTELHP